MQNKIKNTTTNVPKKYEINVKTREITYIEAKDNIYAPCFLLSRLKFRFDRKEIQSQNCQRIYKVGEFK